MSLTNEQKMIVHSEAEIIIVNAFAGTGKTFTLTEFCKERLDKKILYLAYNQSIQQEAQRKFPSNVEARTLHSIAYAVYGNKYKKRLGENKKLRSVDLEYLFYKFPKNDKISYSIKLLQAFKYFINHDIDLKSLSSIPNNHDNFFTPYIKRLWKEAYDVDGEGAFEHDYYLKMLSLDKNFVLDYDYILVDEAQDLNEVMFAILMQQKARKVFIGDSHQKIYGFKDCINAMEYFKDKKGVEHYYLTQTFRCPKPVVEIANKYLYILGSQKELISHKEQETCYSNEIAYIARTNANAILFVCENEELKFNFIGGLQAYGFRDIIDLSYLLSKKPEVKRYIQNEFLKRFQNKEEFLEFLKSDDIEWKSKFNALCRLISKNINFFKIYHNLEETTAQKADVIISTAHKSKGLEFDKVILSDDFVELNPFLQEIYTNPKSLAQKEIYREELNLLYVAITRAKYTIEFEKNYDLKHTKELGLSKIFKHLILCDEPFKINNRKSGE